MHNSDRNQDNSRRDPRAYENPREGRPDERGFQGRWENDDMEMAQPNRDSGRHDHDDRASMNRSYEGDTNRGYSEGNGNQGHVSQGNQGRMSQDYNQGNQGRMSQGNQDYGHQGQGNQGRMSQDYSHGQGNQGRFNAGNQDYGHPGQASQGRFNAGNQDYGQGQGNFQGYGNQGSRGSTENQGMKGRPPRGYKRSDERIQDDICDRLMQQGHIDVGDIEVKVEGGEVTLSGTIESRALKHTVENLVDAVSGVQEIHNQLRVKRQGQTADTSQTSTAGQQTGQKSNVEGQKSNVEGQKGQGTSTGTSEGKQENGRHQAARHTS
jgi:osmotically-inducible protein OsmY